MRRSLSEQSFALIAEAAAHREGQLPAAKEYLLTLLPEASGLTL